jgi:hypothetical protein
MTNVPEAHWSDAVQQADWVTDRLVTTNHRVASLVPDGFEAYVRVLHPVVDRGVGDDRIVRWRDVAGWSGVALDPGTPFHAIAMPQDPPESELPWSGRSPKKGALAAADVTVLAEILALETTTPDRCWFCLWEGYGWGNRAGLSPPGRPPQRYPDPVPPRVRRGPRVTTPGREYFLLTGPITSVAWSTRLADDGQTPNLWWPEDRAWCVASEIDLPWTYVGGSKEMARGLLSDDRIEALPAEPTDNPYPWVEPWIQLLVEDATEQLLDEGGAEISTSRGTVSASLNRPGRFRHGTIRTTATRPTGAIGGLARISPRTKNPAIRNAAVLRLTAAVIGLAD